MTKLRGNKGFTLIEILIVIIIIAVLAGLALPLYQNMVERSRRAEAISTLSATRASQLRYFAEKNTYATAFTQLDYNPTTADTSGQTVHWTYTLPAAGATTFTLTATRNSADGGSPTFGTVSINQAGTVTGTGKYA